jgi:hypothetical protein
MIDTSRCLVSCFPHWGFSRDKLRHGILLKPYRFHDRVTTKQIIPIFPTRFFKGIQEQFDLKIDSVKGGVLQMHFINLIKEAYEEAAHHGLRS